MIGCGIAAERFLRGETLQALGALALFLAIPLAISVLQRIDIPWSLIGPFVLIALGLAVVVMAVTRGYGLCTSDRMGMLTQLGILPDLR